MCIKLRHIITILTITFSFAIIGCGEPMHMAGSNDLASSSLSPEAFAEFQSGLYPILRQNCGACHGAGQAPQFAVADAAEAQNTLLTMGLVDLNNPANSRIVIKINGGHQGFTTALGTQVTTAITNWVTVINATGAGGGLPAPEPLTATFKSISERILGPKCVACHGAVRADGGYRYDTYSATLTSVNRTVPVESKLYQEVNSGSMPRGAGSTPLTNEEVSVILQWIQNGALNN